MYGCWAPPARTPVMFICTGTGPPGRCIAGRGSSARASGRRRCRLLPPITADISGRPGDGQGPVRPAFPRRNRRAMDRPPVGGRQACRVERAATMVAPVDPGDVWAIAGGSFTTAGTYGISPVQVLHWNGSTWKVELSSGGSGSVFPTGLVAVSADDAYVTGQDTAIQQPFIKHWDGTGWRVAPGPGRAPATAKLPRPNRHLRRLDRRARHRGPARRANFLWLRCQH
jgi:hypothetical protein